jgi:hypothetical protein
MKEKEPSFSSKFSTLSSWLSIILTIVFCFVLNNIFVDDKENFFKRKGSLAVNIFLDQKVNNYSSVLNSALKYNQFAIKKFLSFDNQKIYGVYGSPMPGLTIDQRAVPYLLQQRIFLLDEYKKNPNLTRLKIIEYYKYCSSIFSLVKLTSLLEDLNNKEMTEKEYDLYTETSEKLVNELIGDSYYFFIYNTNGLLKNQLIGKVQNHKIFLRSLLIEDFPNKPSSLNLKNLKLINQIYINMAINMAIEFGDEEGYRNLLLLLCLTSQESNFRFNYPGINLSDFKTLTENYLNSKDYDNLLTLDWYYLARKISEPINPLGYRTKSLNYFYPYLHDWLRII